MCMEDIRIGRATYFAEEKKALDGVNPSPIIPADPNRTFIIFPPCQIGEVYLSTKSNVSNNEGLVLAANMPPTMLNIQEHGQLVTAQWFALSSGPLTYSFFYGGVAKQ